MGSPTNNINRAPSYTPGNYFQPTNAISDGRNGEVHYLPEGEARIKDRILLQTMTIGSVDLNAIKREFDLAIARNAGNPNQQTLLANKWTQIETQAANKLAEQAEQAELKAEIARLKAEKIGLQELVAQKDNEIAERNEQIKLIDSNLQRQVDLTTTATSQKDTLNRTNTQLIQRNAEMEERHTILQQQVQQLREENRKRPRTDSDDERPTSRPRMDELIDLTAVPPVIPADAPPVMPAVHPLFHAVPGTYGQEEKILNRGAQQLNDELKAVIKEKARVPVPRNITKEWIRQNFSEECIRGFSEHARLIGVDTTSLVRRLSKSYRLEVTKEQHEALNDELKAAIREKARLDRTIWVSEEWIRQNFSEAQIRGFREHARLIGVDATKLVRKLFDGYRMR